MKKIAIAVLVCFAAVSVYAQSISGDRGFRESVKVSMGKDLSAAGERMAEKMNEKAAAKVDEINKIVSRNQTVLVALQELQKEHESDVYGPILANIVSKYPELTSGKLYECAFENTVSEVNKALAEIRKVNAGASVEIAKQVLTLLKSARYQYKHDHYIFTKSSGWITWEKAQEVHWEVKGWHSVG